jgi:hypothetical protein
VFFLSEQSQLSGGVGSRDVILIMWRSLTPTSSGVGIIKLSLFPAGEAHKDDTSFFFYTVFRHIFQVLFPKAQHIFGCKLTSVWLSNKFRLSLTRQG